MGLTTRGGRDTIDKNIHLRAKEGNRPGEEKIGQDSPVGEGRFWVAAQMKYEGKSFPGKENGRYKGPEAGTRLVCFRKKAEWLGILKSGGKD